MRARNKPSRIRTPELQIDGSQRQSRIRREESFPLRAESPQPFLLSDQKAVVYQKMKVGPLLAIPGRSRVTRISAVAEGRADILR